MSEILTISELAEWLKLTKGQVYTMCGARSRARMEHPLPVLKLNSNIRFRRQDVESWLEKIAKEQKIK